VCACSSAATAPADLSVPAGWRSLAPLPAARQETGVAALGGRIYVIGGFESSLATVATVDVYDPATDRWSEAAPLPEPLHHANVAAVGSRLYLVGALRGLSFEAVATALSYDPAADGAWQPVTPLPPGSERGASLVAVLDGKIIIAGGYRGGRAVDEVSAYDPAGDTWSFLPNLPAPRDHGVGAAAGGVFYAIGGRMADPNSHMPTVYALAGGMWGQRAPMPTSRGGCAGAVLDGQIVVAGGEGNPTDPNGVFAVTESYDPAGDRWSSLQPMKTPRHGTGAAVVGDSVYVPGGADHQAFGAVATVEALRP
jgi:N-acetylneuraminic acid mutarotase